MRIHLNPYRKESNSSSGGCPFANFVKPLFFVSASSFFFCPKPGTWCKLPSFENIFYRRSSTILHIILYYAIDPQQKSIQKQAFEQQLLIKNPQPKQTRPWPRCHIHILQEKKFLYLCRNCSVRFKSETVVRSL